MPGPLATGVPLPRRDTCRDEISADSCCPKNRRSTVTLSRPMRGPALTTAIIALPVIALVATVIFAPSERPTARLVKIIRAWRSR